MQATNDSTLQMALIEHGVSPAVFSDLLNMVFTEMIEAERKQLGKLQTIIGRQKHEDNIFCLRVARNIFEKKFLTDNKN